MIPEAYGGNGLGFLAMVLITEEVARVHSAMRVAINMQIGPALTLLQFGTEEQKQKFIPAWLRGKPSVALLSPSPTPARMSRRCARRRRETGTITQRRQDLDIQRPGDQRRAGLRLHGQELKSTAA